MKNQFWKRVFFGGCAIFCTALVFISLLMLIINAESTDNTFDIALSVIRILLLAIFAFVLSFANAFYKAESLNEWIRLGVHFILATLGFFVCIYTPIASEAEANGSKLPSENALVVMGLFAALYLVIYGIYRLVRMIVKKQKAKKEDYMPVYKKQSRK